MVRPPVQRPASLKRWFVTASCEARPVGGSTKIHQEAEAARREHGQEPVLWFLRKGGVRQGAQV